MALLGYARVSTDDQSLDIQREALRAAGCQRVFEEKASGKAADSRDELQALLKFAEPGDTIIVTKLDRLARSTLDMLQVITGLGKRGITFQALAEPWASTDNPAAELMLTVMAGIAQFERGRLRERQAEGIARAKAAGKYRGRKRTVNVAEVKRLDAEGKNVAEIKRALSCSRQSVYRALSST